MRSFVGVAVVVSCSFGALVSTAHAAGLEGSTVMFGEYYPTKSDPVSQVVSQIVGSGIEFPNIGALALPGWFVADADVDVTASQILIDINDYNDWWSDSAGAEFVGYVFGFSGALASPIVNATLNPSTSIVSGTVSLSVDADTIAINLLPGGSVDPSSQILVDVQLASVPEPVSLGLVGTALGVLAGRGWRRRHE